MNVFKEAAALLLDDARCMRESHSVDGELQCEPEIVAEIDIRERMAHLLSAAAAVLGVDR